MEYNPVKMLGSWIGVILIGLVSFYLLYSPLFILDYDFVYKNAFHISAKIVFLFTLVFGFLIGWDTHSLIKFAKSGRDD